MNPVGEVPGLGAGQPDEVAAFMARARQQQEEIRRIQRGVEAMEVTGSSRHDEVRVTVRGTREVTDVSIDPDAMSQYDVDELGDIITEALNDGLRRAAEASAVRFRPFIEEASPTDAP